MSKNNIIRRENSVEQPDFFFNPVQIHSNGEQGCCSLFFPPPPPPLSLITRPQRKAPPFYSPQKGRGETCASVSAASFCCSAAAPLLCIPTPLLCPSFRGRGNRSPWSQIRRFEQFIYICIQVKKIFAQNLEEMLPRVNIGNFTATQCEFSQVPPK